MGFLTRMARLAHRWLKKWLNFKDDRGTTLQPPVSPTLQQPYEHQLALQRQQIEFYQKQNEELKRSNQDLLNLAKQLSAHPQTITIQVSNQAMAENSTPNISASSGSFVNTGSMNLTGSTINLGEISGTVTNTLQQLQEASEPAAQTLADLLKELQNAIESTPDLDDKNKAKALKYVDALGKLGNDRTNPTLQEIAETAWDALTGILSKAAQLVPLADTLLPSIQNLLGL
jgi:gas vesicle protein